MNKSYSKIDNFAKINLLGVDFSVVNYNQVLEYSLKIIENGGKNQFFVTPNPEIVVIANDDGNYKKILNSADLALADGVGILWAAKILKQPNLQRLAGVDLMENLCRDVSKKPITVGFLGGGPGVAEKVSDCLKEKYPNLRIVFAQEEVAFSSFSNGSPWSSESLPAVDILFVAFGSPKQEIWIYENLNRLPAKITIGVGGAFDFVSGKVMRAPLLLRRAGFEWLFRLIIQPRRIRRQLSLLRFIALVLRERLKLK